MSNETRHEIESARLENDLDELANLLCTCECDAVARYLILESIDVVAHNLGLLIDADVFEIA